MCLAKHLHMLDELLLNSHPTKLRRLSLPKYTMDQVRVYVTTVHVCLVPGTSMCGHMLQLEHTHHLSVSHCAFAHVT